MAEGEGKEQAPRPGILTPEQEAVLDLYIKHLDTFFEDQKELEKLQVEIETLHLKRILDK
jgi:hypothetical protein